MSKCLKPAAIGLALFALAGAAVVAAPKAKHLGIGHEASPAEIAGWDIDIRPDGQGLPPGKGTVKQGEAIYTQQCAACHGEFGESAGTLAHPVRRRRHAQERRSGEVDRLVLALRGPPSWTTSAAPCRSATRSR